MAEAIEALTAKRPLMLVFEDLHWSDHSTLELLAYLARRRERARLLVVGTYRPTEVIVSGHPLKGVTQELQVHGHCEELRLELLTEGDVADYVAGQFTAGVRGHRHSPAEAASFQQLAKVIHRRTDGNALFMVNMIEHLVREGLIVEQEGHWRVKGNVETLDGDVPESLRQLIARQIERLSEEEQQVLEVASVAGTEFAVAAVAAGCKLETEAVEESREELAWQEHFLQERGVAEWPDGTVSGRYQFCHALYQNVLYGRMAEARRMRLHRQIGEREEAGYGERAREIAAELAVHFERGRDYHKAIQYLQQAGENALRRSAYREAISLLTKGLELLKADPEAPERLQRELALQIPLGLVLTGLKGQAASETGAAFRRAHELSRHLGDFPQLFTALAGLRRFYAGQGELPTTRELAQQMLAVAQRVRDPALLVEAHHALGNTLYWLGEFVAARAQLEQGIAVHDLQQHRSLVFLHGVDPGVQCRNYAVHVLWLLGYPDQALQRSQEALTLARELAHPNNLAFALMFAAMFHQFGRERHAVQERTKAFLALATEQGFGQLLAHGTILWGWTLAEQGQAEEGIAQIRQGLAAWRATGAQLRLPRFLAMLAEAYGKAGQAEEGLSALAEALAVMDKTGEREYETELYRLKGELTLQQSSVQINHKTKDKEQRAKIPRTRPQTPSPRAEAEAGACFHKAIEVARRQSAKSLELRAVMSLSRLWQQQGKKKQARQMLAEIYGWFTEGFDTADLREARMLLDELA
ncbi:MAG TPA: hypothetical protein VGX03_06490 [Candidatus Binatia bacterium]|nr:hypothetical protein [Candidatus Binatia bacterium]